MSTNEIEPAARPGKVRVALAVAQVVLGVVYVLNPGAGFIEFIPDNLPIFGNLDEAAATAIVIEGARTLMRRFRRVE